MSEAKKGTLRTLMPETAEIVDWLRVQLGEAEADRIVLGGKQGKGGFRVVEQCPDGVKRVFGSFRPTQWPGGPAEITDDGAHRVG